MDKELSETELLILHFLWLENQPKTFSEIMEYFHTKQNKEWKKQTLNTFLLRLQKKDFLKTDRSSAKTLYIPTLTSEQYYQQFTRKILDDSFQGSLKNFVSAFTGKQKLSQKEKNELLDYIDRL
ncbi:MAG: BlaI/MecI/CopY family transcriptional regulator [Eubacteriales bacterium]|nr:BlaI/MecI/CopY family transcriptional regulator [Eubacteriales bacterium]